jgi:Fe-S cluster assembly protein SufD
MTTSHRGDPAVSPLARFETLRAALPGTAVSWLRDLREQGRERFATLGFPTIREEAWKYTSLRALDALTFVPAAAATTHACFDVLPSIHSSAARGTAEHEDTGRGPRLVFVDGRLRPELSSLGTLPAGVELTSLAQAFAADSDLVGDRLGRLAEDNALVALNTAFLVDGPVLHIRAGVQVPGPVEIVFVSLGGGGDAATAFHPRSLVVAEAGSHITVVEHHVGFADGPVLANHVGEVYVGENASVRRCKVQREALDTFHLSHVSARVAAGGRYDDFILTVGGRLARNEVRVILDGEHASCHVNGAYMVRGTQHCDTTTFIDHARPNGSSREVYKGAIDGHGHGVFQGRIVVRPGAQKTDGHQLNRALLLSETAAIDAKPELEIYADDVKCSHGATAGELDDDAMFYLRARGIDRETARNLLIGAFLAEAIEEIPEEAVRTAFEDVVAGWLHAGGRGNA